MIIAAIVITGAASAAGVALKNVGAMQAAGIVLYMVFA